MSKEYRRSYWLVQTDGSIAVLIAKAEAQDRDFYAAVHSLRKSVGAEGVYTNGMTFSGAKFSGDVPLGWRLSKKTGLFIPDKKTKPGKAIAEQISEFPRGVDGWEFSRIVGHSHWAENHVYFPTYERLGDITVLSIHEDCESAPDGCRRIKTSEYWSIVENFKDSKNTTAEKTQ